MIAADASEYSNTLASGYDIAAFNSAHRLRVLTNYSCSYGFVPKWKKVNFYGMYMQENSSFIQLFNYQ